MTTYILHGGKTSKVNPQNDLFFSQFTNLGNKKRVTVLLCYFARARDKWDALIERDSGSIKKNTRKDVDILVANNPQDLLQKMDTADVLYIAGGDAEPIEKTYKELLPIKEKLQGKIFAGSSMGAFCASARYVLSLDSQDEGSVHKGLGLLPVQVLCHWDIEEKKENKLQLLSRTSPLPIITLNEFEFVTLYA